MAHYLQGILVGLNLILAPCVLVAQGVNVAPADLKLQVQTTNNQTTFQMGEIIPIELSFTSSSPGKYQFNTATYDRSGRMNYERFEISPQSGWKDPVAAYFSSFAGFIGGGLSTPVPPLSATPTRVSLQLNEWVRFERPGQYRLKIVSRRASPGALGSQALDAVSNDLALTIVEARPEWQAATLREALSTLDAVKIPTSANLPEAVAKAVKTLRYLGTPEAAREMVRRIRDNSWDSDLTFGLIGSPAVSDGVFEMERLLAAPDFPVTRTFITTLSISALVARNLPIQPSERIAMEGRYRETLIANLAIKKDAALAISLNTIIEDATMDSRGTSDATRSLATSISSTFKFLPAATQADLLERRWNVLDSRAMLPILPELFHRTPEPGAPYQVLADVDRASAAALKRWYQLAPDEARPVVLQEILRPEPRFGSDVLGILKDETLPSVESVLTQHLQQSFNNLDASYRLSSLVDRYATRAVQGPVVSLLDSLLGKGACQLQRNLLAYLVRVEPVAAQPRLETAMAARGPGFSGCYQMLLTDVGKRRSSPLLQDLATRSLGDADPRVISDAAGYLREFGSAAAESALSAQFTKWNDRRERKNPSGEDALTGQRLLSALAEAQGWYTGEDKLRKLAEQVAGWEQGRLNVERYLRLHQAALQISFSSEPFHMQLGQYALLSRDAARAKIEQFPKGSDLVWSGGGPDQDAAFQEYAAFAREHGITIRRQ